MKAQAQQVMTNSNQTRETDMQDLDRKYPKSKWKALVTNAIKSAL